MRPARLPSLVRLSRLLTAAVASLGLLGAAPAVHGHEEWFRGLDLEPAVARADLILVVRVADVGESRMVYGGKQERSTQQFKFEPVRKLKGIFARDQLLLTTDDLGNSDEEGPVERGEMRLLLLGRAGPGYHNQNRQATLDRSLPRLRDENDPLVAAVKVLIAVSREPDRSRKVTLLAEGLQASGGPAAVPLLLALGRRALLAAQAAAAPAAVIQHLNDPSPGVREAAAQTLHQILAADYLNQRDLRVQAVAALAESLRRRDRDFTVRVAALDALGAAGAPALANAAASRELRLDTPRDTFAERAAVLRGIGALRNARQRNAVAAFLDGLPLDAASDVQDAAGRALVRLDADQALVVIVRRLRSKYAAGIDVGAEIRLLGELPAAAAVPALLDVVRLALSPGEKVAFALASARLADPRLVPALARMLDPRQPGLRWHAIEALRKIDTPEAARVLRPHLLEEGDLGRKLELAAFLGRHGIRDGYAYAIEHVSESSLTEQAVAALAAIRDPRAVPALRDVLKTSNDPTWDAVAIRALGALGDKEMAPRFLDIIRDLKRPLAPAALVALGDLGEAPALPAVRQGLASRNNQVVFAAVRAAGKLLALAGVKADDVRDQLAALLADADAAQDLRRAALKALRALDDPRLDRALAVAVRDAGLEGSELLERVEKLLVERKVKLR